MEYVIAIVVSVAAVAVTAWSIKRQSDCEEMDCRVQDKAQKLTKMEHAIKRLSEELKDV